MKKIVLEYQYFEGCPNHKTMWANLDRAILGVHDSVNLTKVLVEDQNTARRVHFRGSPTLLIDGRDIEDVPVPEEASLSCRFYRNGVPSAEMLRKIILDQLSLKE